MAKNGSKADVIELWGHEFSVVKNGLDETQIASFVNELIGERDLLVQRVEHLSSLTKLAEKAVVEADSLAEEIKREAQVQAEAEASTIMTKAEEQARQFLEEERAKSISIATEEAEAIKAKAEHEVELLIEEQEKRIQSELKDLAQRLYGELLSQLEGLKQQALALETEFENKVSQPVKLTSPVPDSSSTQMPTAKQQEDNVSADTSSEVEPEPTDDVSSESQQITRAEDQESMEQANQDTATYEGEVELEILPPIDITQVVGIMRQLDSLPGIVNTELIPIADKPLLIASLREPMQLCDILMALPEVEQVTEGIDEEGVAVTGAGDAEGKQRKIKIKLHGDAVPERDKEGLESQISDILSL